MVWELLQFLQDPFQFERYSFATEINVLLVRQMEDLIGYFPPFISLSQEMSILGRSQPPTAASPAGSKEASFSTGHSQGLSNALAITG